MKYNVETKEKRFEPIKLTLTIESQEELAAMISLFNASECSLYDFARRNTAKGIDTIFCMDHVMPNKLDLFVRLREIYDAL